MMDPHTRVLVKLMRKIADTMSSAAADLEKFAEPDRLTSPKPPGPPPSVPRPPKPPELPNR